MTWVRHVKRHTSKARETMQNLKKRKNAAQKAANSLDSASVTSRKSPKRQMPEISPDKYFILQNGAAIKSIEDLAMFMDTISDDVFNFHVNEEKNDFANWIKGVFDNDPLAEALMSVKCKKESQIALLKHTVASKR